MSDNIERAIGRLQGTLDSVKESQERIEEKIERHNDRINVVENFRVQVVALGSVAGGLVSAIWHVVKVKIGS